MVQLSRQQRYQRLTIVDLDTDARDSGTDMEHSPAKDGMEPTSRAPHTVPPPMGYPQAAPYDHQHVMYRPASHTDQSASCPPLTVFPKKSLVEAYLLGVSPFGLLGAHHFYLQRYGWGVLYFFTLGLCGCGYLIDLFRMPYLVKQANARRSTTYTAIHEAKDKKDICDAYTLWFPFGLFGLHHYYLGNYVWGVAYTCTVGIFGLGWLVDGFRMKSLVKAANNHPKNGEAVPVKKSCCGAYVLGVSPFGVLGAHHYYLQRPVWGLLYTGTLGLLGLGWVVDWVRMPYLVRRTNQELSGARRRDVKTLDDAYLLWLPFGLLGCHHFYLNRPLWGAMYFFSFGILGLGWLVDLFRLPSLVKDANKKSEERSHILPIQATGYTNSAGGTYTVVSVPNYGVLPPGPPPASGAAPHYGLPQTFLHPPAPSESGSDGVSPQVMPPPPAYSQQPYPSTAALPPPYAPPHTVIAPEAPPLPGKGSGAEYNEAYK